MTELNLTLSLSLFVPATLAKCNGNKVSP